MLSVKANVTALLISIIAVGCNNVCDEATDKMKECGLDVEETTSCNANDECVAECIVKLSCSEIKSTKSLDCISKCSSK